MLHVICASLQNERVSILWRVFRVSLCISNQFSSSGTLLPSVEEHCNYPAHLRRTYETPLQSSSRTSRVMFKRLAASAAVSVRHHAMFIHSLFSCPVGPWLPELCSEVLNPEILSAINLVLSQLLTCITIIDVF